MRQEHRIQDRENLWCRKALCKTTEVEKKGQKIRRREAQTKRNILYLQRQESIGLF